MMSRDTEVDPYRYVIIAVSECRKRPRKFGLRVGLASGVWEKTNNIQYFVLIPAIEWEEGGGRTGAVSGEGRRECQSDLAIRLGWCEPVSLQCSRLAERLDLSSVTEVRFWRSADAHSIP